LAGGPAFPDSGNAGQDGQDDPGPKTYNQRLQDATGRNKNQISEDRLLAESFDDEAMQAMELRGLSRRQMIQIAKLEPKPRNHVVGLVSMGVKAPEAIAQAMAEAAAAAEAGPPKEKDVPDPDWLRQYCAPVRDQLDDPSFFDIEACYYRRTLEHRRGFRSDIREEALKTRGDGTHYFQLIGNDIRTITAEHPSDWCVCKDCLGRNRENPQCRNCHGNGYTLRYRPLNRR
jgi:hypothetical protein